MVWAQLSWQHVPAGSLTSHHVDCMVKTSGTNQEVVKNLKSQTVSSGNGTVRDYKVCVTMLIVIIKHFPPKR